MLELLIYLPFLVPIVVANLAERHRRQPYHVADPQLGRLLDAALRYLTPLMLAALNVGMLGIGALSLLNELAVRTMPQLADPSDLQANWLGVAAAAALTGLLAFAVLLPPLRRGLARWLPIDPDSPVHTTALAYAIYQVGLSLGQLALIGGLENLAEFGLELTIWDVLLSGLPLLLIAVLGVGAFVRRNGRQLLQRLGLQRPTARHIVLAIGVTALLLGLDYAVSALWQEVDPLGYDVLEQISESLFGGLATVGGAIALGLSAGISEELLFRGAVQPRLGLLAASLLFAIGHLQYGLTAATLEVFVIGLVLGLVRDRTNTTICIIIHASYNTVGMLLEAL